MTTMEEAPDRFDTELIRLLLKSSETVNFAPEERIKYINDMTTKRDIENQIQYGIQQGREEGVLQANMEAARKMKELGADVNFICQVSGLTPEQVAAL